MWCLRLDLNPSRSIRWILIIFTNVFKLSPRGPRHLLLRWWCSMLNLNFKSEPSRPEQESDGQRQRKDSRVGQVTSLNSVGKSEASDRLLWPIRGKGTSTIPVRGWLADREVSAALSESSSRTFHPCHAIRSHYRPRQQHFETLRDTWGHWPVIVNTCRLALTRINRSFN